MYSLIFCIKFNNRKRNSTTYLSWIIIYLIYLLIYVHLFHSEINDVRKYHDKYIFDIFKDTIYTL